jgi:hypothetical protein
MSQNYNNRQKTTLTLSVLCLLLLVPILIAFQHYRSASMAMFLGCIMTFFFVVELKAERILKGFGLIIFGIFAGMYYPEVLFYTENVKSELPKEVLRNLHVFEQLLIFACAGAGGSIIANHADQSSTDREDVVVTQTVIDKTESINKMFSQIEGLNKKLNSLIYFLIFIIIVGGLVAIAI